MDSFADPYATARASLRENVKTMATMMAGAAAAILAGSPFSGIGSLEIGSYRLWLAVAGLAVVAVCLFLGWRELTFTLRPDVTYLEVLRSTFAEQQIRDLNLPSAEQAELVKLKEDFQRHRRSLLPTGFDQYEDLEKHLEDEWVRISNLPAKDEVAEKKYAEYDRNFEDIGYWATFTRLSQRVKSGLRRMQTYGAVSLAALLVFAWAANPPKANQDRPIAVHVAACASCPVQAPPAPPRFKAVAVRFQMNDSALDEAAYAALNDVAVVLRLHPELGALLLAHTDMVAGERVNKPLAARRANAVRAALTGQGGVANSRVFSAELPLSDLPVLTGPGVAKDANRAVEVLLVELPTPPR